LEKVGVYEEWSRLTSLGYWGIRANETGWGFTWNFLNILGFIGIDFIEVSVV
jgi:hypothetical protein